jgi:hypothetical protein
MVQDGTNASRGDTCTKKPIPPTAEAVKEIEQFITGRSVENEVGICRLPPID